MTSFQGGTNSGYLSAAPYRLNTQLFEEEYEFMSGLPSIFTIQNNMEKKPIYDTTKGFLPTEKNDNISVMEKIPECAPFLKFLSKYKLLDILMIQPDYTLFVPTKNVEVLDQIVQKYGEIVIPQDLLKYHMVNYTILPIQLLDQILRLETGLRNQTVTIKNTSIMTYYDEINLLEDNKIRNYYRTDNGSLYLIDRPLVYDIYNYF
jgi:uncharacterized surface protein with fasciclin (FAS1) repeats